MALTTQFKLQWHDSDTAGRLALVTMDNGADYRKPNTFGSEALESLDALLEEVEGTADAKGLLLTGKQFIFAVGADLDSFVGADEAFAREAGSAGHTAFARLAALEIPTLAAINGACMGGGLEIALHCDYRTLSTGAAAVAFPEVFLNILPGWGGTQLTPRLIGGAKALELIVTNPLNNNKVLSAAQAFEAGLADRFIDSVDFLDASVALLEKLVTGEETITREAPSTEGLDEAVANAKAFAWNKVHGATNAPTRAIELIEFAARGGDLAEGRRKEIDGLAELLPSRQAQASVYAFNLTQQRAKKQPWRPAADARRVKKVAVIGSGLMGAQLGTLFLRRLEVPLVMKDINDEVLVKAREHIEGELDKLVAKGRMKPGRATWMKSLVTYTTEYDAVAGADFVIEAVLERMDLKKVIFADVEKVVDAGAILATNTSSLSVAEMAADLAHPERVVGFHFFNPVAVLPLVEIAATEGISDEALATAYQVAKGIKKTAVGCADTPAFIVNRLLTRFMGACSMALQSGNTFKEVDDAILELGLPMGPFLLMELVGLKVAYHTAETLNGAFPDRFPIDPNMKMMAEDAPGIFDWSKGGVPFDVITENLVVDADAEKLTADQIRSQALEAIADEIKIMLDTGAVADARDIDTCMMLGAGWPFFNGGICKYLDQTGISEKLFGQALISESDQAVRA